VEPRFWCLAGHGLQHAHGAPTPLQWCASASPTPAPSPVLHQPFHGPVSRARPMLAPYPARPPPLSLHGCAPPHCWALVPSRYLLALPSPGHLVGAPRWCSDLPSEDAWIGAMSGDTRGDADRRLPITPHPHPSGRSASPFTLPGRIESSAWPTDRVVASLASRAPLPAAGPASGCGRDYHRPGAGGVWGP